MYSHKLKSKEASKQPLGNQTPPANEKHQLTLSRSRTKQEFKKIMLHMQVQIESHKKSRFFMVQY